MDWHQMLPRWIQQAEAADSLRAYRTLLSTMASTLNDAHAAATFAIPNRTPATAATIPARLERIKGGVVVAEVEGNAVHHGRGNAERWRPSLAHRWQIDRLDCGGIPFDRLRVNAGAAGRQSFHSRVSRHTRSAQLRGPDRDPGLRRRDPYAERGTFSPRQLAPEGRAAGAHASWKHRVCLAEPDQQRAGSGQFGARVREDGRLDHRRA